MRSSASPPRSPPPRRRRALVGPRRTLMLSACVVGSLAPCAWRCSYRSPATAQPLRHRRTGVHNRTCFRCRRVGKVGLSAGAPSTPPSPPSGRSMSRAKGGLPIGLLHPPGEATSIRLSFRSSSRTFRRSGRQAPRSTPSPAHTPRRTDRRRPPPDLSGGHRGWNCP
jgi:hypothetical protein